MPFLRVSSCLFFLLISDSPYVFDLCSFEDEIQVTVARVKAGIEVIKVRQERKRACDTKILYDPLNAMFIIPSTLLHIIWLLLQYVLPSNASAVHVQFANVAQ